MSKFRLEKIEMIVPKKKKSFLNVWSVGWIAQLIAQDQNEPIDVPNIDSSDFSSVPDDLNDFCWIDERGIKHSLSFFDILQSNNTELRMIIENVFILLDNDYIYYERVVRAKNELETLVKSHKKIIEDNTYNDYTGILKWN